MQIDLQEINEIAGTVDSLYHEAAMRIGLTDSEFDMFYVIMIHGEGCNQSLLYKETGLRKSTVNTSIRKLEKADVLYLKEGEGRNTKVYLTAKGRTYLKKVKQFMDMEEQIYASWSKEEQELFMNLNRRYVQQLKEAIESIEGD